MMCTFGPHTTKPDPALGFGLLLKELLGCLPLLFVHRVRSRLNVDRDELVRFLVQVDVRSHALIEQSVAPLSKFFVAESGGIHGTGSFLDNRIYIQAVLQNGVPYCVPDTARSFFSDQRSSAFFG